MKISQLLLSIKYYIRSNRITDRFFPQLLVLVLLTVSCTRYANISYRKHKVVWQPSHQTDTGKDFSEALTCNGIVEGAMATEPELKEYKVWSLGKEEYHHADSGSNTKILHTTAIIDGKRSGYAYELERSNKIAPSVFIAVHNNGGTKRHGHYRAYNNRTNIHR